MTDTPWTGDACSLVEAFRAGERSPVEELEATLAAIDASELNAVSFVDHDGARAAAAAADVSKPFGGVPFGVKQLAAVKGWPYTHGSVPFADDVADRTSTRIERIVDAGGVAFGITTTSEFGGVNQTTTKLCGATRNPWDLDRTPGGSSGGSAAAVAGGLCTIASASDGGGSIRIPAGFCGLLGLKPTYGRVPKGPRLGPGNLTSTFLCVSRSVRDTARWLDCANGHDPRDPLSLPRVEGYERGLDTYLDSLRGTRATVMTEIGGAVVAPETAELVEGAARWLIGAAGLVEVDTDVRIPSAGRAWGLTGGVVILDTLGDRWPECADDLTGMMRGTARNAEASFDAHAAVAAERSRVEVYEAMADLFEDAPIVFAATNPDVAFGAEAHLPSVFGGRESTATNNGALTIPANVYGCPAISVPIGLSSEGLPIGLQILAPHHHEEVLLDLARVVERERPWPLLAPAAPC